MVREVVAEVVPAGVNQEQEAALSAKVEQLLQIENNSKAQRILCYYDIGTALIEVYEDINRGSVRFGSGAIKRLADALGVDDSTMYRAQEVAIRFTRPQIEQICGLPRVGWSHVLEVVRLPTAEQRMEVLNTIPTLPSADQTVAALRARVAEIRQETAGEHGEEAPPDQAPVAKQKGGGSRTGTGHGASPLTPVKRVFKQGEALNGSLTNLVIMLKEFDPDSEAVAEKVAEALDASAGVLVELMAQTAGSLQLIEEYLASFKLQESQQARRSMVSQVIVECQSYLNHEKAVESQVASDKAEERAVEKDLNHRVAKAAPRAVARPVEPAKPLQDRAAVEATIQARRAAALAAIGKRR